MANFQNTEKERMAKLFQSAMQASPARFVPVNKFTKAKPKFAQPSIHPIESFAKSIPVQPNFAEIKENVYAHKNYVNCDRATIKPTAHQFSKALTNNKIYKTPAVDIKSNNQEAKINKWIDNCQNVHYPAVQRENDEFQDFNHAETRLGIKLTESDFINTVTDENEISKDSTESGEVTDDSKCSEHSTLIGQYKGSHNPNNSTEITSFTVSSAVHSTAIEQSLTYNPIFIDAGKDVLPQIAYKDKKIENDFLSPDHTFAPYRNNQSKPIIHRKDSGYSTTTENNTCTSQPEKIKDEKVSPKSNPVNYIKTNQPNLIEKRLDNHLAFNSCKDHPTNFVAISEASVVDPNTTFKPKKSAANDKSVANNNMKGNLGEAQIIATGTMDCCNMTMDDQFGIVHSPTTHKNHKNEDGFSSNVRTNIANKPKIAISDENETPQMKEEHNQLPLDFIQKEMNCKNLEVFNSQKRRNYENIDNDNTESKSCKKLKLVKLRESDYYNDRDSNPVYQGDNNEVEYKESNLAAHSSFDNLENEIMQKLEEIEEKDDAEKWRTIRSLINVICNSDSYLPKSVKITALHDVIEIIRKDEIPIMQIIHEEKNFIECIGKLATYDNIDACDLVLVFLKRQCKEYEPLRYLSIEVKKQIYNILKYLVKCNDAGIQNESKAVFKYLSSIM